MITQQTHLSLFGLILGVLGEEVGDDVAAARGHVHHGTLLAQTQSRRDAEHHAEGLHEQCPFAQVAADDETREDGFYLGDTGA